MRIGIDARFWSEQGHGRYIRNLVYELEKIDRENEYVLFLRESDFEKCQVQSSKFTKVKADVRWYRLKEQLILPWIFYRANLDLLHVPHFNIPLLYFKPFVVTIHDLTVSHFTSIRSTTLPMPVWKLKRFFYHVIVHQALHRAKKIIAVSKFTKSEIRKVYPTVKEEQIVVTLEAVEQAFVNKGQKIAIDDPHIESIKTKYGINHQYLLFIGNVHPHKNIDRLIRVADRLSNELSGNLQLVLVGKDDYFQKRLKKETNDSKAVVWTGFVLDDELISLFKGAAAFVFPSLTEGFGIPPLEAMACGTPTIVSKAGSLPEVCGKAALYINPHDEEDMATKIKLLLTDPQLRLTLIQEGYQQIKQFSWKKMAKQTLEVYQNRI